MSRDAKIGLVIVFAFVFLFGTILVHRLQPGMTAEATKDGAAATDGGDSQSAGGTEASSALSQRDDRTASEAAVMDRSESVV